MKIATEKEIDRLERLTREAFNRVLQCIDDARKTRALPTIRVEINVNESDDRRASRVTAMVVM